MKIIALLTSHNRRASTLACLRSFYSQQGPPFMTLSAVLVDDASTDGTAHDVAWSFPQTKVIEGSGDLYWARGMALAEEIAASVDPDYLLWLNDDVVLDQDAVGRLVAAEQNFGSGRCIVVGAVRDPSTGEVTYSGVRRRGLHPLRVEIVEPRAQAQVVELFHGNVVLVSLRASRAIGPIDGGFSHAQADFDYSLRSRRCGLVNILATGTFGTCVRDGSAAPWLDGTLPVGRQLRLLFGRKGLPPRSAARYLKRHGGPIWPVFWIAPYVRALVSLLRTARITGPRRP